MAWLMDTYANSAAPGDRQNVRRAVTGKPVAVGGSLDRTEATGNGTVHVISEVFEQLGKTLTGSTAAIQGFGNVGTHTALGLAEQGVAVLAITDAGGGVHSPDGLEIARLVDHARVHGTVAGFDGADHLQLDDLIGLDVDLLVPAALENQIDENNVGDIKAHVVANAANGPITPAADELLTAGGIEIVPDILTNAGGVIVSYAEWVQNKASEQ